MKSFNVSFMLSAEEIKSARIDFIASTMEMHDTMLDDSIAIAVEQDKRSLHIVKSHWQQVRFADATSFSRTAQIYLADPEEAVDENDLVLMPQLTDKTEYFTATGRILIPVDSSGAIWRLKPE